MSVRPLDDAANADVQFMSVRSGRLVASITDEGASALVGKARAKALRGAVDHPAVMSAVLGIAPDRAILDVVLADGRRRRGVTHEIVEAEAYARASAAVGWPAVRADEVAFAVKVR